MSTAAPRIPADPLAALLPLTGVQEAVAEARAAVDGLLSHRVLRRGSAEVTAESALRGARASAELEGAGIELERLRGQLMGGGTVTLPSKDERGARLVEVGTTNKTRLGDYAQAITPDTKVLLKVHASNYRIIGFTAEATLPELIAEDGARRILIRRRPCRLGTLRLRRRRRAVGINEV